MTIALLFWICLLLYLVLTFLPAQGSWRPTANGILLALMLLLLGWGIFGAPIK